MSRTIRNTPADLEEFVTGRKAKTPRPAGRLLRLIEGELVDADVSDVELITFEPVGKADCACQNCYFGDREDCIYLPVDPARFGGVR